MCQRLSFMINRQLTSSKVSAGQTPTQGRRSPKQMMDADIKMNGPRFFLGTFSCIPLTNKSAESTINTAPYASGSVREFTVSAADQGSRVIR